MANLTGVSTCHEELAVHHNCASNSGSNRSYQCALTESFRVDIRFSSCRTSYIMADEDRNMEFFLKFGTQCNLFHPQVNGTSYHTRSFVYDSRDGNTDCYQRLVGRLRLELQTGDYSEEVVDRPSGISRYSAYWVIESVNCSQRPLDYATAQVYGRDPAVSRLRMQSPDRRSSRVAAGT